MPLRILKTFLATLLLASFSVGPILAQTPTPNAIQERQVLEGELRVLEAQIAQYETEIKGTQQERQTLQNKIKTLQNKIKQLNLQIKQGNLMITDLKGQIQETQVNIVKTTDQLAESRAQLKESLRRLYQEGRKESFEILLTENSLSDFFTNLANLETLNSKTSQNLANVKALKAELEGEKVSLDKQTTGLQKLISVQSLQKTQSLDNQKQQETILETTKGKETLYQQYLAETKKRAAEIRSRIFELIGVAQAPSFGQAYDIAKLVQKSTGIRPAFLLAVLTQESNIGKNVGQCYLTNKETGEGVRLGSQVKVAKVMSPTRDVPAFLEITKALNRDPFQTPVSCPIASVGGYGGAMGPAQFIPRTWTTYGPKVQEITGQEADPWNIRDAFFAAGLYLKDLGGAKNEFTAAMKYFSGGTWTKYEEFYGRSVLEIASRYKEDIKTLDNNLAKIQ